MRKSRGGPCNIDPGRGSNIDGYRRHRGCSWDAVQRDGGACCDPVVVDSADRSADVKDDADGDRFRAAAVMCYRLGNRAEWMYSGGRDRRRGKGGLHSVDCAGIERPSTDIQAVVIDQRYIAGDG